MAIVITGWGFNSYLNLLHKGHFTEDEYWHIMRPDILRLNNMADPQFNLPGFWSPASTRGITVQNGWKMKWHNMGPGRSQIRLPVLILGGDAYLCEAYVKNDAYSDARGLARFSAQATNIGRGTYIDNGRLR